MENSKLLISAWSIQLAMFGSIALDQLGIRLWILQGIVAFIYLTFVPGAILGRALGLRPPELSTKCAYWIGLSISTTMLMALGVNSLGVLLGVKSPLSLFSLSVGMATVVTILTVFVLTRTRASTVSTIGTDLQVLGLPPVLFLLLLPILAVLGTRLMNFSGNNAILVLLLLLVATVPLLAAFDVFIDRKLYPLAVVAISLALLWHHSLISNHLTGWDVNIEYYAARGVQATGYWDPYGPGLVNSMLSVTILPVVYSSLMGLDLLWVFKIVYPAFFAVVPLVLFRFFKKKFDDKTAFLATFFFIAFSSFFAEVVSVLRQEVAELFFALFLLLLLDAGISSWPKTLMLLLFGFAMAVSHYGLSYFFLFFLTLGLPLSAILKYSARRKQNRGHAKGKPEQELTSTSFSSPNRESFLKSPSPSLVALLFVFAFAWYVYTSGSAAFASVVLVVSHIAAGIGDLFNPGTRDPNVLLAIGLAAPSVPSIQRFVFLALQYLVEFLIVVGLVLSVRLRSASSSDSWFYGCAIIGLGILGLAILLPHFASAFNVTRIYHITLFFLSPFVVSGGIAVIRAIARLSAIVPSRLAIQMAPAKLFVIAVLVPYFLFSTGMVFQVTGDVPTSISLSPAVAYPRFSPEEVAGAQWLQGHSPRGLIFGDQFGSLLLDGYAFPRVQVFWGNTGQVPLESSIFLRCANVDPGLVAPSRDRPTALVPFASSAFFDAVASRADAVYDSGCAQVLVP